MWTKKRSCQATGEYWAFRPVTSGVHGPSLRASRNQTSFEVHPWEIETKSQWPSREIHPLMNVLGSPVRGCTSVSVDEGVPTRWKRTSAYPGRSAVGIFGSVGSQV